ncbi:MAG: argininosuccinate lyase [Alphaproteobacteria bacterium]|nr:argininosuccinate lyase [Alphaproteobacteria bacterium]
MWGGRFAAAPSDAMQAINASIDIDQRLWRQDIQASKAHAAMLAAQGILTAADEEKIQAGLDQIAAEIEDGRLAMRRDLEDIHLNIEHRLTEIAGDAGRRLHTARSRNDQVATDFRLWIAAAIDAAMERIERLQRTLVAQAEPHADWAMPGFTHLQTAQPITLGHHLMAYVEMLERDRNRLLQAKTTALSDCPLGAAALAGTGFPIDRERTAAILDFTAPAANSLDAVSARDFALEALSGLAIALMHASRLAEEIVLWTSPHFRFARLSDAWSTGSSIMPQKRNPDAAELIRAKATRVSANYAALLGIMKALPLAYAKDLQEDKALTFEAFDAFMLSFDALAGMIETITFDKAALRAAAGAGFSTATDLADWLVRELKTPFRDAHHVAGRAVKRAEELGLSELGDLPLADLQAIDPRITDAARALLGVEQSLESRASYGGTAPARVREQIARWKEQLG